MNLTEKIKQKAKSIDQARIEILANLPKTSPYFANRYRALQTALEKKEWVKVDDVLALLDNYQFIPVGKWQEIVELTQNRPTIKTDESFDGMLRVFYDNTEVAKFFEVLEAKVAELKEVEN